MNDAWQKLGAVAAGSGTLLSWFSSIDAGAVTTFVVAVTGISVWAYKQIEAARRENRVAWIREIAKAQTDAQVEAMERIAEIREWNEHADRRIEHNSGRIDAAYAATVDLKGRLKDKGVIDGSDPDCPMSGG